MTQLVARLILAMLILPFSIALWFFLILPTLKSGGPPTPLTALLVWLVDDAFIACYWLFLWRSSVRWTRSRTKDTWLVTGLAILAGTLSVALGATALRMTMAEAIVCLGAVVPIVWILGTVLVWKETAEERVERLKTYGTDTVCCPTCGYNMTGLHEARCPECGARFTVDELLTAQHEREQELQRS